ncbi:MAG: hypothetical protein H6670_10885 [Anaerolineaceae bacterium]|nr:hypothetical protein [Anaerolineaceae bacterium]
MNVIEQIYIGLGIVWWSYYVSRLLGHGRDPQFLRFPWLMLWLSAYLTGFGYLFNSYYVLQRLDTIVLPQWNVPFAMIARTSLYFFVAALYTISLKKLLHVTLVRITFVSLLLAEALNLSLMIILQNTPYSTIYWCSHLIIFFGNIPAFVVLGTAGGNTQMMSDIALAHHFWQSLLQFFLFACVIFNVLAAIYGLSLQASNVYSIWQILAYGCSSISILCLAIVTAPDTWLYKTLYPVHVIRYRKLHHLCLLIARELEIVEPNFTTKEGDIHVRIHAAVIYVLDNLPFLNNESLLKKQITSKMQGHEDLQQIIVNLSKSKATRWFDNIK